MLFNIYEEKGIYANKNLINANIVLNYDELHCHFYFGKDYKKTFGNKLFKQFSGKPLIEINLIIDNSNMSDLVVKENDDIFDKESSEYDKDSLFIPLSSDTPSTYKYRLSAFYVLVKDFIESEKEKTFFGGIGHSLLCWVFSKANLGTNNILALEASGDGNQEELVKYYTKLGFKTCIDVSNVPKRWFDSSIASGICMYSTIDNFNNVCASKKRTFKTINKPLGPGQNPFRAFQSI